MTNVRLAGMNPTSVARYAGGLLAGLLLIAAGGVHPQHAAANDYDLGAPTLVSASLDGTEAYVGLRDNSDTEAGYIVYAYLGSGPELGAFARAIQRPGIPGQGRTATVTVDKLNATSDYCFVAYAAELFSGQNGDQLADDSPQSNIVCAHRPATNTPHPSQTGVHLGPPTVSDAKCLACGLNDQPSTTTNPVLPDFSITRISGNQAPVQGIVSVYDVVLANLGARPQGQVQVEIQIAGALQYQDMAQTPAGFTCTGNGPIVCVGPLGGYGDAPITTVADFQLQIYAANTGIGSISAAADPSNLIQESNEANNAMTLTVTVK